MSEIFGKRAENPRYQSDTYYDVVVGNGRHEGWYVTYVGMGDMIFSHPQHGDRKFTGGAGLGWMQDCWNEFLKMAEATK